MVVTSAAFQHDSNMVFGLQHQVFKKDSSQDAAKSEMRFIKFDGEGTESFWT